MVQYNVLHTINDVVQSNIHGFVHREEGRRKHN